jgi:hypothetical protein
MQGQSPANGGAVTVTIEPKYAMRLVNAISYKAGVSIAEEVGALESMNPPVREVIDKVSEMVDAYRRWFEQLEWGSPASLVQVTMAQPLLEEFADDLMEYGMDRIEGFPDGHEKNEEFSAATGREMVAFAESIREQMEAAR